MVGDGSSDLATQNVVDLFVGYGGVVARDKVKNGSEVFIQSVSLAPILPIATGQSGYEKVKNTQYQAVFEKGIRLAISSDVLFKDDTSREIFARAFNGKENE